MDAKLAAATAYENEWKKHSRSGSARSKLSKLLKITTQSLLLRSAGQARDVKLDPEVKVKPEPGVDIKPDDCHLKVKSVLAKSEPGRASKPSVVRKLNFKVDNISQPPTSSTMVLHVMSSQSKQTSTSPTLKLLPTLTGFNLT